MATGRETQLTKQAGEYLVAAELARRGFLAATFSGNVPHYDIIASGQHGGHVPIQVKTKTSGSWQLDIRSFANVRLKGKRQTLGRSKPAPYPGLVFVFVALNGSGRDSFYIIAWSQLRSLICKAYRAYLPKHHGRRPRNPASFHTDLDTGERASFENRWSLVRPIAAHATSQRMQLAGTRSGAPRGTDARRLDKEH